MKYLQRIFLVRFWWNWNTNLRQQHLESNSEPIAYAYPDDGAFQLNMNISSDFTI